MGEMSVLNRSGDSRFSWDSDKPKEVEAAKAAFDAHKKRGLAAFSVRGDWRQGAKLEAFDAEAERIIFVPPIAGG